MADKSSKESVYTEHPHSHLQLHLHWVSMIQQTMYVPATQTSVLHPGAAGAEEDLLSNCFSQQVWHQAVQLGAQRQEA